MIITGDDLSGILSDLQDHLRWHFKVKSLSPLHYFLVLGVSKSSDGYFLSKAKYVLDLISHVGLTKCKTISTPLDYDCQLTPFDVTLIGDPTLYR